MNDRHIKAWRWDRHQVKARTKSEARAALKAKLGLDRLPVGANVCKVAAYVCMDTKRRERHR